MKARIHAQMSAKERKAMNEEIRRQCVESVRQYEIDLDTVVLYVLHEKYGFGEKRLRDFYREVFKSRLELQEHYMDNTGENIAESVMRTHLLRYGIDVEEMYKTEADGRFVVKIT